MQRRRPTLRLISATTVCCAASIAAAQGPSVTVDCAGASIPSSGSTAPDITRTSTATILAARGYQFAFNPTVTGTGLLGLLAIGGPKPLSEVLNGFFVGGSRTLFGAVRNPSGALPTKIDTEVVGGTFSGLTISLTLRHELLADGRGRAAITNIVKPGGLGLNVNSGGLVVTTWTPPVPVVSEWHFEGDLLSVLQSGVAWGSSSGPSRLRWLDDPAFGPLLGGVGNETNYPSPATPTGVSQAQSAFGTATAFGIPPLPGLDPASETVLKVTAPRNAGDPANTAKSRGLGLTLWPNTREFWPEDRIGQWTMVWDLLIPASAWNAALANTAGNNVAVALVEDSQNNNSAADAFIRVAGAGPGAASVGHSVAYAATTAAPTILPDQWFRLALVIDHYGAFAGRIFVNGAFVGVTGSDWVYNACKGSDPRWGNPPTLTPIPPADWAAWGQFPSPWAQSATSPAAPTASTLSLFADLLGQGESVYVANLMFTDEAMIDAQVAALGGPNARGIVYQRPAAAPCPLDLSGNGVVDADDIFAFLNIWFAGPPGAPCPGCPADWDGNGVITADDIFAFLNQWFAFGPGTPCP